VPGAYLAHANRDGINPGEKYVRVALVHDLATIREALERVIAVKA
jgi:N-succinyldiaminopimelate aminotransferase